MARYSLGEGPYGSAYRGDINDLFISNDMKSIQLGSRYFGLFVGHFDWHIKYEHKWQEANRGLIPFLLKSSKLKTHEEIIPQTHDLRFTGDQHHLLVAGTGAGKFRDALSNMLLFDGSCETACLVIDPKGEIASATGPMLEEVESGSRVVILDPWNVCKTGTTQALTFLEGLTLQNPHCVKDARILADAIIIHRQGDGGHWDATAKNFLTALLLYVAVHPAESGRRTLLRLRQLVTMPWSSDNKNRETLGGLLGHLAGNDLFGGIVARSVQAFLNREPRERGYILSTIERDTEFVEDPALWKAADKSTLDIDQLVLSNRRLHVVLPFDYVKPMSSWLRLAIASFYNACLRNALPENLPKYLRFRHIVIDEFAGLGNLDFIVKDIAEARGAGIKYHLVVQSFSQLKGIYGEGWETFVSNSFIQAFGIDDIFTSEYLSKMTGQSTVVTSTTAVGETVTTTTSISSSTSRPTPYLGEGGGTNEGSSSGRSESRTITQTFSTVGRPVLMADEIRRLGKDEQLVFIRGMPVFLCRRQAYYETFAKLLVSRSLKEVLAVAARKPSGAGSTSLVTRLKSAARPRLIDANSNPRPPSFTPPAYRPQTLRQALVSELISPRTIVAVLIVMLGYGGIRWLTAPARDNDTEPSSRFTSHVSFFGGDPNNLAFKERGKFAAFICRNGRPQILYETYALRYNTSAVLDLSATAIYGPALHTVNVEIVPGGEGEYFVNIPTFENLQGTNIRYKLSNIPVYSDSAAIYADATSYRAAKSCPVAPPAATPATIVPVAPPASSNVVEIVGRPVAARVSCERPGQLKVSASLDGARTRILFLQWERDQFHVDRMAVPMTPVDNQGLRFEAQLTGPPKIEPNYLSFVNGRKFRQLDNTVFYRRSEGPADRYPIAMTGEAKSILNRCLRGAN